MIYCSVCNENRRDVIISKCSHTFCKSCVAKSIGSRQRRCLHCKEKISEADVKPFYFNF